MTFHNEENGFCVLRVKARGHRDLVTVSATPRRFPRGNGSRSPESGSRAQRSSSTLSRRKP
ncbi:YrrC family ATP-dependent DNA helicase [Methylocystis sp. IM2]|uniref:YrrC family ATP-dependent DNA helicase n=1 Tax=unclassified Methylocystis TaxID=2625913 RepID=UPI0040487B38